MSENDTSRTRTYSWDDPMATLQIGMKMEPLDYMQAMLCGDLPRPPIADTLDFVLREIERGRAIFTGQPAEYLYNPIGVVHGGYAATLLDSALGCAIHTMLAQGTGYTTLQLNVHLTRAITKDTGTLYAEGKVLHSGRRMATAEATLKDEEGKLYAHGTTTCMIFELSGT